MAEAMHRETTPNPVNRQVWRTLGWCVLALAVLGAYSAIGQGNYLLFHVIAELFSIAVAWGVFLLVWAARKWMRDDALVFIGTAYLFVGILDLLHTLAYKGMGVFPPTADPDLATQIWIAGRALESASLLGFSLLVGRTFPAWRFLWPYAGVTALLVLLIYPWSVFPTCYVEGSGLTAFKRLSEGAIVITLVVSGVVLWQRRDVLDPFVWRLMLASIGFTVVAELCFVLYLDWYGLFNRFGHAAKVLSFLLVYRALIYSGLSRPYAFLFKELAESEQKFQTAFRRAPVLMSLSALENGAYLEVNDAFERVTGYTRDAAVGSTSTGLGFITPEEREKLADSLKEKGAVSGLELRLTRADGSAMWCLYSGEVLEIAGDQRLLSMGIDITDRKASERQVRESEARFRGLFDHAAVGMAVVSLDGKFLSANGAVERILGYSREELNQRQYADVTYPDDWRRSADRFSALLNGETDYYNLEKRYWHKDGHVVWGLLTCSLVRSETSEPRYAIAQLVDISSRKQAEEALRLSETRYREFLQNTMEGISMLRVEPPLDVNLPEDQQVEAIVRHARFAECNERYATYFGFPDAASLRGLTLAEALRRPDSTSLAEWVRAFVRSGYRRMDVLGHVGGERVEPRWLRGSALGIIEDGHLVRVWGTQTDVTSQRHAELERERLLSAIDQAAEVVVVTDAAGTIQYVNPAFERVTGYTAAEALGRNPRILKSERHGPDFYERMWETLTGGGTWQGQMVNRAKDGSLYTEEATISPVFDDGGELINYVAVKRDVSRELEMEEQLRQSQKMEAIGTLAGGIAHDFNNIIAAITGYAELLEEDLEKTAPESLPHVEQILRGSERAAELVGQILAFSRKAPSERQPILLGPLVKETTKMLRGALPSTIAMDVRVEDESCCVVGDITQLDQVIMNLCTNASHAMAESGGTLTIRVSRCLPIERAQIEAMALAPGTYIKLLVKDTGAGIREEDLPHVFEPFFTTKPKGKGTGMGLSVAHGVVKSHGGVIAVRSKLGEGTLFEVYLPCAAQRTLEVPSEETPTLTGGSERILIVDDEEPILDVSGHMLRGLGYDVTTCPGGSEGLAVFMENPGNFDLVVTDLTMPEVTGLRLAREVLEVRPDIGLVLCTGYGDKVSLARAREVGFHEILAKPMRKRTLAEAVRRVLDELGREKVVGS